MSIETEREFALAYDLPFESAYAPNTEVIYDDPDANPDAPIELPFLYEPRDYQAKEWDLIFNSGIKRFVRVWHRRAGKDKDFWNIFIAKTQEHPGQYYYFLPTIAQAKKVIYEGIDNEGMRFIDHIPEELIANANKGEMSWELINGSIIRLAGSDNFDDLVGTNIRGMVFSEWSLCNPLAWDYFEPMLRMNGGWAAFVFTARGRNHGYDIKEIAERNPERWHLSIKTIDDTGLMSREEYDQMLAEGKDPDIAAQEYYCSFDAAVKGAYFARQMEHVRAQGRYLPFPVEQKIPCVTYWDIGKNDMMSITICQFVGDDIRIVQYYEKNNEDFNHYADWLNRWRDFHGVTFSEHWAPHDIEVREFTGKGLKTRKQLAKEAGIKFITRERISTKEEGISLIRQLLPKCYFRKTKDEPATAHMSHLAPMLVKTDPSGCDFLMRCLSNFHQKYDEKRKRFLDYPDHDWSSHAVDSVQNLAQWHKDRNKPKETQPQGRKIKRKVF